MLARKLLECRRKFCFACCDVKADRYALKSSNATNVFRYEESMSMGEGGVAKLESEEESQRGRLVDVL